MPEVVQLENGVPTTSEGAMASGMVTASTVAMASPMGPRGGWRWTTCIYHPWKILYVTSVSFKTSLGEKALANLEASFRFYKLTRFCKPP